MADGGPGTAALVSAAGGGELIEGRWRGPLGDAVAGAYALIGDGGEPGALAVIEAATAAGLTLLPEARRDPARASTHGVGEQIRDALTRGVRRVVIGVGGTGTNDGGAGAAQALGYRLLDAAGREIGPGGLELARLARIDDAGVVPLLRSAEVRVAVDVTNPLLGVAGATAVYGPQKGVTADLAPRLEAALARWADLCQRDLGVKIAALEGGGAGGGLAAGLVAAAGASVESGGALVSEAIGLPARVAAVDLVVTGEGRLDAQTARGKTVTYIAALAREAGRPCLAVAGVIEGAPQGLAGSEYSARSYSSSRTPCSTRSPAPKCIAVTTPACGARSSFCIFIASTTISVCPTSMSSPTSTRTSTTTPARGAMTWPGGSSRPPTGPRLRPAADAGATSKRRPPTVTSKPAPRRET